MKHFTAIALASSVMLPSIAHPQPSFDCRKAGTATEKAICASSALADLDLQLAQVFKAARSRAYLGEYVFDPSKRRSQTLPIEDTHMGIVCE